jgi:phage anti-repressor protein
MKKKLNDMSQDMFNDAMSSTPIPVFTTVNDAAKNETSDPFTKVPEVSWDGNQIKNELIKIDFDKQTVSARALHEFFELAERFSAWCKRMFSYGLVENVDFATVGFPTVVNNNGTKEIGDYLLTIDAAKHIAMVQRSEKGRQARNYFINIEKLYWKNVNSKNQNPVTSVASVTSDIPVSLLENLNSIAAQLDHLRSSVVQLEKKNFQQQQMQSNYDSLVEKTLVLEKQFVEQAEFYNLKAEYIERTILNNINSAVKASFSEADQLAGLLSSLNLLKKNYLCGEKVFKLQKKTCHRIAIY